MEWIQKILEADTSLFLFLNSMHNEYWDTIMLMVTRKETWFPFYAVLIYYFIKNYRSKAVLILFFLALTILACDQISVLIKYSADRLRPVYQPEIEHLVHNVLRKGGKYGFVSSHAANSFGIFIFSIRVFRNRGFKILMFIWALWLSYSRIYSGVHYPGDIVGGALLGLLLGYSLYKLLMFIESRFFIARSPKIEKTSLTGSQARIIWLVFLTLVITVFIISGILHHYNYL